MVVLEVIGCIVGGAAAIAVLAIGFGLVVGLFLSSVRFILGD